MVTKVTQIVQASPYRPNFIINGSMDINQRQYSQVDPLTLLAPGTSFCVDRFAVHSTGTFNVSAYQISAFGTVSGLPEALQMSLNAAHTPGASEFLAFRYAFEEHEARRFTNRDLVLSFDVNSAVAGEFCVALRDITGNVIVLPYTINAAGSWERKHITIPKFSFPLGTTVFYSLFVEIFWVVSAGSGNRTTNTNTWISSPGVDIVASTNQVNIGAGNTFTITGVRLEEGTTATDYIHDDIADHFERCLRYYQTSYSYGVKPGTYNTQGNIAHEEPSIQRSAHVARITFPKRMRSTPTIECWSVNTTTLTTRGPDATYALGYGYDTIGRADIGVQSVNISENGIQSITFAQSFVSGQVITANRLLMHYVVEAEI